MLQPWPFILLQVGLDLALAGRPKSRLIHRQDDKLIVARQHSAVESRVNCADILLAQQHRC